MRWRTSLGVSALTLALATATLYPAIGQRAPQSILPPGFGEPERPPEKATPKGPPPEKGPTRPAPAEKGPSSAGAGELPEIPLNLPTNASGASDGSSVAAGDSSFATELGNATEAVSAPVVEQPEIRRPVEGVGMLGESDGGLRANAWAGSDGRFLNGVIMRMRAPIASRWMSITLRRALLSRASTPREIGAADWVAARAWLLVRMGEADNARALVEGVDSGNYTPWLNTVAMQAALATADPAALCGIADAASRQNSEVSWLLARAMCAALAGESGTANAYADQARDTKRARGVDLLLVQKVMGVGTNARRVINIQWEGVQKLNAWRFGLATATGLTIPERLLQTTGPQVRAWQARAPLLAPEARVASADWAATLGVFSNTALVDFYGTLYDNADPSERSGTPAAMLRDAYSGAPDARLSALKSLLGSAGDNRYQRYARLILGARAATLIAPADGASSADDLIAAMMSSGFDIQAARWAGGVSTGSLAWALLATGAPRPAFGIDAGGVRTFSNSGADPLRGQFLFAGLAGLGRVAANEVEPLAKEFDVPIGKVTPWSQALDAAVRSGSSGSVVLLCAAGMQSYDWRNVPPAHLYRIVSALRAVGLEPEARMIAAEALTRA